MLTEHSYLQEHPIVFNYTLCKGMLIGTVGIITGKIVFNYTLCKRMLIGLFLILLQLQLKSF